MAVFIALTPILVLAMAAAMGQERFTSGKGRGDAGGYGGRADSGIVEAQCGAVATPFGDLLAFLGTLAFSIYTVAGKDLTLALRQHSDQHARVRRWERDAAAAVVGLSIDAFQLAQMSAAAWWSFTYMVVFSSVIAYLIYYLRAHVYFRVAIVDVHLRGTGDRRDFSGF